MTRRLAARRAFWEKGLGVAIVITTSTGLALVLPALIALSAACLLAFGVGWYSPRIADALIQVLHLPVEKEKQ